MNTPKHVIDKEYKSAMTVPANRKQENHTNIDCHVFEKTLAFDGTPLLFDHKVEGVGIIPAAAQLEMAIAAARVVNPKHEYVLLNAVFRTPIEVPKGKQCVIQVQLVPIESGFEFSIQSRQDTSDSAQKTYASGRIEKAPVDVPQPPAMPDMPDVMSSDDFYLRYQRLGLDYGPTFRSIFDLCQNTTHSFAQLRTPDTTTGYLLHPALLDGALQVLASLVPEQDVFGKPLLTLPFSIASFRILQKDYQGKLYAFAKLEDQKSDSQDMYWGAITLLGDNESVVATLKGVCLKRVNPLSSPMQKNTESAAPWLKQLHWHMLTPSPQDRPKGNWLLFADTKGIAQSLANSLRQEGNNAILVTPDKGLVQVGADQWQLPYNEQHSYRTLLEKVVEQYESLVGVIYLSGCDDVSEETATAETEWVENHTLAIINLVQALATIQTAPLYLVSTDGVSTGKTHGELVPARGALWGLGRVLNIEYAALKTKLIDIQVEAEQPQMVAQCLLAELAEPNHHQEIVIRDGKRWTPRVVTYENHANETNIEIRRNGVYLITGGLGDIGLAMAEHLIGLGAGTLYLLGRNAPADLKNNKHPKLEALLNLQRRGARIVPIKADVADASAMQNVFTRIQNESGAIHGVIHSAGVIHDGLIANKNVQDVSLTLRPKITGARVLADLLKTVTPDFLILYSSATSVFGNIGQCDYAVANSYLDQLAHKLSQQGIPTRSLNWSLWSDIGMGKALVDVLERRGFTAISNQQAMACFDASLQSKQPQLVIAKYAGQGPQASVTSPLPLSSNKASAATMAQEDRTTATSQQKLAWARRQLVSILSEQLKLPTKAMDVHAPFLDFGIDSIIAVDLVQTLEQRLSVSLRPTLFFEYGSIEELAGALVEQFNVAPPQLDKQAEVPDALQELIFEPKQNRLEQDNSKDISQRASQSEKNKKAAASFSDDSSSIEETDTSAIAVIGMAGRFPDADTIGDLWQNLCEGIDVIKEVPKERWDLDAIYDSRQGVLGRTYGRWGGFLKDIDCFDPAFFRLSPKEAKAIDPQQRLALELSWQALEHAGYAGGQTTQYKTGVYVGASYQHYRDSLGTEWVDSYLGLGNHNAILANRISYLLNCHGPCMTVDTLCSSSLVALHLAVKSLRQGEIELALVGGVHVGLSEWYYRSLSQLRALSPRGRCSTFDESADGYVPGEGGVMLLLKPLQAAVADGDNICGIVRGTAVNHGGRASGLTVPRVDAQTSVIEDALKDAACSAADVSYVEAHGTGTALGDPIELQALTKVFASSSAKKQFCGIGSLKSHLGHLEPAAGAAGLVKVLAAMQAKQLPPTQHFNQPNHRVTFEDSPFFVSDHPRPWPSAIAGERLAGVSSFGMGGVNAHAVIQEAPEVHLSSENTTNAPRILRLAAHTRGALDALIKDFRRYTDNKNVPINHFCYSANTGRGEFENRVAIVFRYHEQLSDKFKLLGNGDQIAELASSMIYVSPVNEEVVNGSVRQSTQEALGQLTEPQMGCLHQWCHNGEFDEHWLPLLTESSAAGGDAKSLDEHQWLTLLNVIAMLYTQGVDVDWQAIEDISAYREGQQPKRIPLPTYPFQRSKYSLLSTQTKETAAKHLHPLLDNVIPSLDGALFEKRWTSSSPLLKDHKYKKQAILPAAAILTTLAAAHSQLRQGDVLDIKGFSLLNKAVVTNTLAMRLQLAKAKDTIRFSFSNAGESDHEPKTLAEGTVLSTAGEPIGQWPEFMPNRDEITQQCSNLESIEQLYQWFEHHAMVYGQSLRLIESIKYGQDSFIAELSLTASPENDDAHALTSLLDAALQCVGVIARRRGKKVLSLPFAAERIQLQTDSFTSRRIVVCGHTPIDNASDELRVHLAINDAATGKMIACFANFEFRTPLTPSLPAFKLPKMFTPEWRPQVSNAVEIGEREVEQWFLLREPDDLLQELANELNQRGSAYSELTLEAIEPLNQASTNVAHLVYQPNTNKPVNKLLTDLIDWLQTLQRANKSSLDIRVIVPDVEGQTKHWRHGCLAGMLKVAANENPSWQCQVIGIGSDELNKVSMNSLIDILSKAPSTAEISLRNNAPYQPSWTPLVSPATLVNRLNSGDLCLITGGLGAVGLVLARHLYSRYNARLILVSRREEPREGHVYDQIQQLRDNGADVQIYQADLSKPNDVNSLWQNVFNSENEPDAVFHLAGQLRDGLIRSKSKEDIHQVLAPKLGGLDKLTEYSGLLVLFSSVSSFSGNQGQSDYAAANHYLDLYAQNRTIQGLPVLSISWGLWGEVGAGPSLLETTRARGFEPLETESALAALDAALASNAPLVCIPGTDLNAKPKIELPNSKLKDNAGHKLNTDYQTAQQVVVECFATQLEVPAEQVTPNRPFLEMGMDSISAVSLAEMVEQRTGLKCPKTLFFDYATPTRLAQGLVDDRGFSAPIQSTEKPAPTELHERTPSEQTGFETQQHVHRQRQQSPLVNGPIINTAQPSDIAVIGMSGRFPGANNLDEYWSNLDLGQDCISEIPPERWRWQDHFDSDPNSEGKTYSKWGGFISELETFDAAFFRMFPREAEALDPQQRLLLESTWSCLENAAYTPEQLSHASTGVYVGASYNHYRDYQVGPLLDAYTGLGNHNAILANRLSYFLNINGPCMTVDTLCASSLVAVHLAVRALRSGECKQALAAGVHAGLSPWYYQSLSRLRALSPDGRCKTFDSEANGYVPGEGVGVVLLKPLSQALKDRDHICGVIKGTAVNHGGQSSGLTVPNSSAQTQVIRSALSDANISADTISYVETHGTGTSLGDPIETRALTNAFKQDSSRQGYCAIGSVKSQIGHLEPAAGIAGLIKVMLAFKAKRIPASLHVNTPNPECEFIDSPFYVNTRSTEWPVNESSPRRAGVSSFGLGGVNAHAILEQAPERLIKQDNTAPKGCVLTLSAHSAHSLKALINAYSTLPPSTFEQINDLCFTASVGRVHFSHRLSLFADSPLSLQQKIEKVASLHHMSADTLSQEKCYLGTTPKAPKIAFIFTGQGSQYKAMGRELYQSYTVFREAMDECDQLLKGYAEHSILDLLYHSAGDHGEQIHQTGNAQPALFSIGYSLAQLYLSWGIGPSVVMGHSLGELIAACIAGVMTLEDAILLVAERARLMQSLPLNQGAMASVFISASGLKEQLTNYPMLAIAAENSAKHTVVSGDGKQLESLLKDLENKGVRTVKLATSHGFHSPQMDDILPAFRKAAQKIAYSAPHIPLISNLTGKCLEQAPNDEYWANHLRHSVSFTKGVECLQAMDVDYCLEIGPRPILSGLIKDTLGDSMPCISSLKGAATEEISVKESLAQLYSAGTDINWAQVYSERQYQRISLPNYVFERQRYWLDTNHKESLLAQNTLYEPKEAHNTPKLPKNVSFMQPIWQPVNISTPEQQSLKVEGLWLVFDDQQGLAEETVNSLKRAGADTILVQAGTTPTFDYAAKTASIRTDVKADYLSLWRFIEESGTNRVNGILHFWHCAPDMQSNAAQEVSQRVNQSIDGLLSLAQSIDELQSKDIFTPAMPCFVFSDKAYTLKQSVAPRLDNCAVTGMVRSLSAESSNVLWRCIDIDTTALHETNLQKTINQLLQVSNADEMALRGGNFYRRTLASSAERTEKQPSIALRRNGVYIITGGLGDIGKTVGEYLAREYQAKLVLMGRQPLIQTNASCPRLKHIRQLESYGAEVLYVCGDVANEADIQKLYQKAKERFNNVNGVFHVAGIASATQSMLQKEPKAIHSILAPKVWGTYWLGINAPKGLDVMMLFSSASAINGTLSRGIGDYALANASMERVANWLIDTNKLPVISMLWPEWLNTGLAKNTAVGASGNRVGLLPVTKDNAIEAIAAILREPNDSALVVAKGSNINATDFMAMSAKRLDTKPLPKEHNQSAPIAENKSIETTVLTALSKVIKVPLEELSPTLGFAEIGMDSLSIADMVAVLEKLFGQSIEPSWLLEHPTPRRLSSFLSTRIAKPDIGKEPETGKEPNTPENNEQPELSALLKQLKQGNLSLDQAEQLLETNS